MVDRHIKWKFAPNVSSIFGMKNEKVSAKYQQLPKIPLYAMAGQAGLFKWDFIPFLYKNRFNIKKKAPY